MKYLRINDQHNKKITILREVCTVVNMCQGVLSL